jgi:hypothetical protein
MAPFRRGVATTRRTISMNPFDALASNKVWQALKRQEARDPLRINLTDLWRAADRPRLSPRRWRHGVHEVRYEGDRADDPAWADAIVARIYAQLIDLKIMMACCDAVFARIERDPAGFVLDAPEGCKTLMAAFASPVHAKDGDRTAGDRTLLAEIVQRTEGRGVYAQETAVAQAQRAFASAKRVRTGRLIDGEFVPDR